MQGILDSSTVGVEHQSLNSKSICAGHLKLRCHGGAFGYFMQNISTSGTVGPKPNNIRQEISDSSIMGAHLGDSCHTPQLQILWGPKLKLESKNDVVQEISYWSTMGAHLGISCHTPQLQILWGPIVEA